MAKVKDPYKVLGVERKASQEEINRVIIERGVGYLMPR